MFVPEKERIICQHREKALVQYLKNSEIEWQKSVKEEGLMKEYENPEVYKERTTVWNHCNRQNHILQVQKMHCERRNHKPHIAYIQHQNKTTVRRDVIQWQRPYTGICARNIRRHVAVSSPNTNVE